MTKFGTESDARNVLTRCVALTGSIATGKSTVATILSGLGAHLVDTDVIARQVVEPGMPALKRIADEFGESVINPDGTLNREKVRSEIIRDAVKRERLNGITHPEINRIVLAQISGFAAAEDDMPVIIDVPLLFEAGWDRIFPRVILVYAPREVQILRLMERDRLDRSTAELTVNAQLSIEEKKDRSTYIIDNSGTLEQTRSHVIELFAALRFQ